MSEFTAEEERTEARNGAIYASARARALAKVKSDLDTFHSVIADALASYLTASGKFQYPRIARVQSEKQTEIETFLAAMFSCWRQHEDGIAQTEQERAIGSTLAKWIASKCGDIASVECGEGE